MLMQLDRGLVASYTTGRIAMATKKATAKTAAKKTAAKKAAKKSTVWKYSPSVGKDVEREMKEMKKGTLKSGRSGKKVTNPKQAIAIALSEARKEGKKVPPPPKKG
jgi:pyruvate/2-oxoglutarate dehydrogenase complex dihydrolipoamide acyltransferase (E2) component